ncbi:MAG: hypothetical protein HY652_01180 [Acidobacteria bacterium]|nr:hypothetical protein [Acidobacteriota bacterium]
MKKWTVALPCILAAHLFAGAPKFWEISTQAEFLKGRLKGLSLTSDGKLVPAPSLQELHNTGKAYLFCAVNDTVGNLYVGSGHEGQVFKITPQGQGTAYYKAAEIDVYALETDLQDRLFVGSSPDGKVYRVTGPQEAQEFFDPKEKYIWSLLADGKDNLYVGTGGKGILYKVDAKGKGGVFYDSDDTHIISLARDIEGNLLAGTAPNGYLYRIDSAGKGFVLLDAPQNEIRSIAVDRYGNIYAAALSDTGAELKKEEPKAIPPPSTGEPTASVSVTITTEAAVEQELAPGFRSEALSPAGERKGAVRSAVYKITRDHSVEMLWSSTEDMVYSLLIRADGTLLASTGPQGRVLSIHPEKTFSILVQSPEEQMTGILEKGNELIAITSNLGKVYRISPERSTQGEYESEVLDAKSVSSWGMITWKVNKPSGASIAFFTRSGNTQKPDKTWTDWAGPYKNPDGEHIQSPRARYLTWKAVFSARPEEAKLINVQNAVESVLIAYLQQNLRPQVQSINILPPSIALQKIVVQLPQQGGNPTSSRNSRTNLPPNLRSGLGMPRVNIPPRRVAQPGAQSFTWEATDENQDELTYSIYYKGENESNWKLLEEKWEDTFYTIDSNTLPDGTYLVKVVASDSSSNPSQEALLGELISKTFDINNTPPSIEILSNQTLTRRVEVAFRAQDRTSRVYQAEYSLDGGEWQLIFPKDGIADSKQEDFTLKTEELSSGEHTLGLRVTNTVGVTGTHKLVLKIP